MRESSFYQLLIKSPLIPISFKISNLFFNKFQTSHSLTTYHYSIQNHLSCVLYTLIFTAAATELNKYAEILVLLLRAASLTTKMVQPNPTTVGLKPATHHQLLLMTNSASFLVIEEILCTNIYFVERGIWIGVLY